MIKLYYKVVAVKAINHKNKLLENKLIILPKNQFREVAEVFGRDEMFAGIADVLQTSAINELLKWSGDAVTEFWRKNILSISGPVLEKFWFYIPHLYHAVRDYQTQPPSSTHKPVSYFLKRAITGGNTTLLWDVLIHDPLYFTGMYAGLTYLPETPVALTSAISYITGILCVAFLQVAKNEFDYKRLCSQLLQKGMEKETFYESRFILKKNNYDISEEVINDLFISMSQLFNLTIQPDVFEFTDTYHELDIHQKSGRNIIFRNRQITHQQDSFLSTEIVFTRASRTNTGNLDQYQFFITKKEKYLIKKPYKPKDNDDDYPDKYALGLRITKDSKPFVIIFHRRLANNPEDLSFSIDDAGDYWVLELKCYKKDIKLIQAMREVMLRTPGYQTTIPKNELMFLL